MVRRRGDLWLMARSTLPAEPKSDAETLVAEYLEELNSADTLRNSRRSGDSVSTSHRGFGRRSIPEQTKQSRPVKSE